MEISLITMKENIGGSSFSVGARHQHKPSPDFRFSTTLSSAELCSFAVLCATSEIRKLRSLHDSLNQNPCSKPENHPQIHHVYMKLKVYGICKNKNRGQNRQQ